MQTLAPLSQTTGKEDSFFGFDCDEEQALKHDANLSFVAIFRRCLVQGFRMLIPSRCVLKSLFQRRSRHLLMDWWCLRGEQVRMVSLQES